LASQEKRSCEIFLIPEGGRKEGDLREPRRASASGKGEEKRDKGRLAAREGRTMKKAFVAEDKEKPKLSIHKAKRVPQGATRKGHRKEGSRWYFCGAGSPAGKSFEGKEELKGTCRMVGGGSRNFKKRRRGLYDEKLFWEKSKIVGGHAERCPLCPPLGRNLLPTPREVREKVFVRDKKRKDLNGWEGESPCLPGSKNGPAVNCKRFPDPRKGTLGETAETKKGEGRKQYKGLAHRFLQMTKAFSRDSELGSRAISFQSRGAPPSLALLLLLSSDGAKRSYN